MLYPVNEFENDFFFYFGKMLISACKSFITILAKLREMNCRFLQKNQLFFRQINVFTKKLLMCWFHENFRAWSRFVSLLHIITVWKLRKFTLLTLFWQKFRESNVFTKYVPKELIWRNIFFVEREFLVFPLCDATLLCNHGSEINF